MSTDMQDLKKKIKQLKNCQDKLPAHQKAAKKSRASQESAGQCCSHPSTRQCRRIPGCGNCGCWRTPKRRWPLEGARILFKFSPSTESQRGRATDSNHTIFNNTSRKVLPGESEENQQTIHYLWGTLQHQEN